MTSGEYAPPSPDETRACSSAGRAPRSQCGGHRFDPGQVHRTSSPHRAARARRHRGRRARGASRGGDPRATRTGKPGASPRAMRATDPRATRRGSPCRRVRGARRGEACPRATGKSQRALVGTACGRGVPARDRQERRSHHRPAWRQWRARARQEGASIPPSTGVAAVAYPRATGKRFIVRPVPGGLAREPARDAYGQAPRGEAYPRAQVRADTSCACCALAIGVPARTGTSASRR